MEVIVEKIPKDYIFDSYFVINTIIKNHSDDYLQFAAKDIKSNQITLSVHGRIGQVINSFNGKLIRKTEYMSWSDNIHGIPSECTSWVKL